MAALVEAAPVGLVMTDRDLRILLVSPRWRRDMGMENVDVIGRRVFDIFPHAEQGRKEGFCRALAGETVVHERLRFRLPNGQEPWVRAEATPWRDADGAIGGLLLMTHDITEMVVSLERAERSERRLRLATELSDLAVWEMDYRDQKLETGGAMSDDMREGMTYASMTNIWDAVHPADRAKAIALWDRHVETGEPYRAVHRLTQRDGPHIWVSVAAEAIRGVEGDIDRVVGVLRNIDREKRSETAMAKALAQAEAASRAKNEFLANMSHEIRTPLNGVMGIASVLGRADLSPEHREMVEIIESSAKTLEVLLSDVLDLARIEAGRLTLIDEPFDLAKALHVAAALFEPRALEKGLAFKSTISPAARAMVRGDVTRLRQVISNLLSNAVKFTDQGRVSLNVEAEQSEETVRLRLSVLDTGIGFDAETGQRLFQRFEQADGSITRRFGGTGLGLSISRSLAEAMGGTLSATSTPGRGSAFTLELELPRAAEILPQEPAPPPTVSLPAPRASDEADVEAAAPRILLAEDHPTNRKVVSLILESVGVDLLCVEDGVEALAAFDAGRFDLILMDMQMPRMDGLTAIRSIRARERRSGLARTPILLLTANAMPEHAEASASAGADGHLTKPISANELIAAVTAACEGAGSGTDAAAKVA
jgi:PAS domain S-box-containing protein